MNLGWEAIIESIALPRWTLVTVASWVCLLLKVILPQPDLGRNWELEHEFGGLEEKGCCSEGAYLGRRPGGSSMARGADELSQRHVDAFLQPFPQALLGKWHLSSPEVFTIVGYGPILPAAHIHRALPSRRTCNPALSLCWAPCYLSRVQLASILQERGAGIVLRQKPTPRALRGTSRSGNLPQVHGSF